MTKIKLLEPAILHSHSYYSMLDAVPSPTEWIHFCIENDIPGYSCTDHGTATSMYELSHTRDIIAKYNKKNGTNHPLDKVTGIPGIELYLKITDEDIKKYGLKKPYRTHFHITAWAISNEGFFNLSKIASLAYDDIHYSYGVPKARTNLATIKKYMEGIRFGSGCIASPMGSCIFNDDLEEAEKLFLMYKDVFGDNMYIEFHPSDLTMNYNRSTKGFDPIEPNECACDGNMQKAYNIFLKDMLDKHGGKPIPATDAHFIHKEDKQIQDIILKSNNNGWHFSESYHHKPSQEIFNQLQSHLGKEYLTIERYNEWVKNTYEVMDLARNINVEFKYSLPKIEIPQHIKSKESDYDKQTLIYLMELCKKHGRWNDSSEYLERFKKEIDVIYNNSEMNFIPYFLLYEDIGSFARSQGILQNIGRGSAGGSLVSYYLKIIHIDPIVEDLPFERFMSHARIAAGSWADIDSDFGQRLPIVNYLKAKYDLGFAQIATFQTMKLKKALKFVMKAIYDRKDNDPEVMKLCKMIPDSPQGVKEYDFVYGYYDSDENYHQGMIDTCTALSDFYKQYDIEPMVKRLLGTVSSFGRHASAFIISTDDLASTRLPTMKMKSDDPSEPHVVTQYEAGMCEDVGLVKADILNVTNIQSLEHCVSLVKESTGIDYLEEDDKGVALVYRLPDDDKVYDDFYRKDTDSSFQFNTPVVKQYIKRLAPRSRRDLAAVTALLRPGAMDGPMQMPEVTRIYYKNGSFKDIQKGTLVPEDKNIVKKIKLPAVNTTAAEYYMDVQSGVTELRHIHPDLEEYTTNSVFVYQEEIMKLLVDFAGYTLEESDRIRGAIAKKKLDIIQEAFVKIKQECSKRGWTEDQAELVCQQIQAFARYSFNRSHARSYAELGYITMYMKHHHPLEWWSGVLTTAAKSSTSAEKKLRSAVKKLGNIMGIPSIKNPVPSFTPRNGKIIPPLNCIKGISPKTLKNIMKHAPYSDIDNFISKAKDAKITISHLKRLVAAGVFSEFIDTSRPETATLADLMRYYVKQRKCTDFPAELYNATDIERFSLEQENNLCFHKTIASLPAAQALVLNTVGFKSTGNTSIPYIQEIGKEKIYVLRDIEIAENFYNKNGDKQTIGLILMYKESRHKEIVSKKTGKKYNLVEITLTDGFREIVVTKWNATKALRASKNSIVYVEGKLKEGFKNPVALSSDKIEILGK